MRKKWFKLNEKIKGQAIHNIYNIIIGIVYSEIYLFTYYIEYGFLTLGKNIINRSFL